MSRITDTERGARIALDIAAQNILQPKLFANDGPALEFWQGIECAANDTLDECAWSRQAMAQA